MPFVNVNQFVCVLLSILVLREGCLIMIRLVPNHCLSSDFASLPLPTPVPRVIFRFFYVSCFEKENLVESGEPSLNHMSIWTDKSVFLPTLAVWDNFHYPVYK